jgi:hypothetical protein
MDISKSQPEGNAFAILGAVKQLLKNVGREDEVEETMTAMMAGTYDELCAYATWVTFGSIRFTD